MEKLIAYENYLDIIGDRPTINESEFDRIQVVALSVIKFNMTQVHIFPETKNIFKFLKEE